MARRGVHFRRADNARVTQRGALGGWDQLRARLIGDTIRTPPVLQHDAGRPEDVDSQPEDHAAGEVLLKPA